MEFSIHSKMEEYYQKFIELQEKLRQSEEERMKLELRFREIVHVSKEEEQAHYRKLRAQYKLFLEEDRKRQDRNERIIRNLERIETKIAMLSAKTERFNILRRQYQSYLQRVLQVKMNDTKAATVTRNFAPSEVSSLDVKPKELSIQPSKSTYENPAVVRVLDKNKNTEEKIEILDKYLQSLSSERCRYLHESERRARENLLPFENDRVKFDANQANSVADDIMNSIYSRYYNKEGGISTSPASSGLTQSGKDLLRNTETVMPSDIQSAEKPAYNYKESPKETSTKLEFEKVPQKNIRPDSQYNENYELEENKQLKDIEDNEKTTDLENHTIFPKETSENLEVLKEYLPVTTQLNESKESTPKHVTGENNFNIQSDVLQKQILDEENSIKSDVELVMEQSSKFSNQNNDGINQQLESTQETNNSFPVHQESDQGRPPNKENSLSEGYDASNKPTLERHESIAKEQQNNVSYDQRDIKLGYTNEKTVSGYAENGQPITVNSEQAANEEQDQLEFTYDNKDQLNTEYDVNEQVQYDQNGQPIQYDENGQPIQYDENGQPIQYDENGQPVQYSTYDQTLQYDQYGQPILYDENGQPLQPNYHTEMEAQYDENGQLIPQYDENGQLIPQYDPNQQFMPQYDENGQLLSQYDENGQIIPQYDENGQLIQQYSEYAQPYSPYHQDIYDENGQLVENYNNNEQVTQDVQQYITDDPAFQNQPSVAQYSAEGDQNKVSASPTKLPEETNQSLNEHPDKDETIILDTRNEQLLNEQITRSETLVAHDSTKENSKNKLSEDVISEREIEPPHEQKDQMKPSNVLQMLETDSESVKQNTSKISNDSDFEFSNG